MSETTHIEWARCTGGPWLGCTEVSPGCLECYARELLETRLRHIMQAAYRKAGFPDWETRPVWGNKAPRVLTKGFWEDAYRFDRQAAKSGERWRMFPSMIDWLDDMPAGIIDQDGNWLNKDQVLVDFLEVVHKCKNLDWLLLTKRPGNWQKRVSEAMRWNALGGHPLKDGFNVHLDRWLRNVNGYCFPNVWIGASVEDQDRADKRIPELLKIPAKIRFLSCEPLLGEVELDFDSFTGCADDDSPIHWLIAGVESIGLKAGRNAQHYPDHARSLRDQCRDADVAFFHKQMPIDGKVSGDPSEWPEDLRVRQYPGDDSETLSDEEEEVDVCPRAGDSRDPNFDPSHRWEQRDAPDGTSFRICARCKTGEEM